MSPAASVISEDKQGAYHRRKHPLHDAMGQEKGGHTIPCHPALAHKVLYAPPP